MVSRQFDLGSDLGDENLNLGGGKGGNIGLQEWFLDSST